MTLKTFPGFVNNKIHIVAEKKEKPTSEGYSAWDLITEKAEKILPAQNSVQS